jgi:diphthamide biosynthesis protein 3
MPQYDEIEIEDMTYDPETLTYSYPCPCGDRFKVSLEDLWDGEDIADCNSCTLYIQVIYEESDLPPLPEDDDSDDDDEQGETTKVDKDNKEKDSIKKSTPDDDEQVTGEMDMQLGMGKLSIEHQESNNKPTVTA